MRCLIYVFWAVFGTLALAVATAGLRYVLWPLGWLLARYWDWCHTIEDSFHEVLFAVTPLVALFFAALALIVCLGAK